MAGPRRLRGPRGRRHRTSASSCCRCSRARSRRSGDRFGWSVSHVLVGLGTPDVAGYRGQRAPRPVTFLCGVFGALAVLAAACVLLRPRSFRRHLQPDDEQRLRVLLDRYGDQDSLGYFATRRDKSAIFSDSRQGGGDLPRRLGRQSRERRPDRRAGGLAGGDPGLARRGALSRLGAGRDGRQRGGRQGVRRRRPRRHRARRRGDHRRARLLDRGTLDARRTAGRDPRRALRATPSASGGTASCPPDEMRDVIRRADAWRDTETERGFSMALSRLGDPADGECVLVEAMDADGQLRALLSFVPWGMNGLSLDLMRRDRSSENGVTEFMVTSLIERARTFGVERISLNFAMFRAAFEQGERIGRGPVLRLWRGFLLLRLEVVAARVALPREREVPADVVARASCATPPRATSAARCRVRRGRGLHSNAEPARAAAAAATRGQPCRRRRRLLPAVPQPRAAWRAARLPRSARRPARRGACRRCRSRRGFVMTRYDRLVAEGIDPYPVGHERTATAGRGARALRGAATRRAAPGSPRSR